MLIVNLPRTRAGGTLTPQEIVLEKPGFLNNTFAHFLNRPHAKACGYTNQACQSRLEFLEAALAAFECNSDTLQGIGFLTQVWLKKPGFWDVGNCRGTASATFGRNSKLFYAVPLHSRLYYVRSITHDREPGHGMINVTCLSEIPMMPCPYATTE